MRLMDKPLFHPRRPLGRTGFVASRVGVGDVADRSVPLEQCVATVRRGIAAGCNVVDTAPMYEEGYSERIVGAAVRSQPRDSVFVIDKVDHLDRPAEGQVLESLERLGLEYTDLFVLHGCSRLDAWRAAAAPGGHMHQLGDLIAAGRTRFRGISSHNPDVLAEAIPSGLCDVVMFPIGPFVDRRYETEILPLARRHEVGTVCFKTFGAGKLLSDTSGYGRPPKADRPRGKLSSGGVDAAANGQFLKPADCIRYTLTLDPDVALLGLSFPNEQDAAWPAATAFTPMSQSELADLRRHAAQVMAGREPHWWNPAV
ncbi:MAG: hypothetical protein BIFFINMI_02315 [Phycisphaerae bacterium]|nr:hypothetical protein [Phycisphaerae bacterium]